MRSAPGTPAVPSSPIGTTGKPASSAAPARHEFSRRRIPTIATLSSPISSFRRSCAISAPAFFRSSAALRQWWIFGSSPRTVHGDTRGCDPVSPPRYSAMAEVFHLLLHLLLGVLLRLLLHRLRRGPKESLESGLPIRYPRSVPLGRTSPSPGARRPGHHSDIVRARPARLPPRRQVTPRPGTPTSGIIRRP